MVCYIVPELQFQSQKISVRNDPVSQNCTIQNPKFSCKESEQIGFQLLRFRKSIPNKTRISR